MIEPSIEKKPVGMGPKTIVFFRLQKWRCQHQLGMSKSLAVYILEHPEESAFKTIHHLYDLKGSIGSMEKQTKEKWWPPSAWIILNLRAQSELHRPAFHKWCSSQPAFKPATNSGNSSHKKGSHENWPDWKTRTNKNGKPREEEIVK